MKYVECPHCRKQADTPPFIHGWFAGSYYGTKKCQNCGKELTIKPLVFAISGPIFVFCSISLLALLVFLVDFINKNTFNIASRSVILGALILMFPVGFPLGILWVNYGFPFIMGNIFRIQLFQER